MIGGNSGYYPHAAPRHRKAWDISKDLNLLLDSALGHAIYMLDPDGHVMIWSKGAERLTGWTEAEAVGQHIVTFYPPEAIRENKPGADLARALKEGRLEFEDWRQRKDGSQFLANIMVTALYDDQGKLRGFAKILTDITKQRAAEEALSASESHLRSILSTVPDAMVVTDETGVIVSFSFAAEALFGYTAQEVLGQNVKMLMSMADRPYHDGYLARYRETGEKHIIGHPRSVLAERKNGEIFPVELSVGEAQGDHGRIFTGFIRDMTERRRAEEKVAELQAELIHVSRVSAMGAMASTLAHELNQPITAVVNYVEGVRNLLADPKADDLPIIHEALDDAAQEALRAGDIVKHLRDFVARGEVEKTVESLPRLINEAASFGLMGAQDEGVAVSIDLDPEASPVLVDKVQIQQLMINLIRNAIEAMSHSSVRKLTIKSGFDPEQDGFVRVSVSDTGPGVPPPVAANMFRAFVSTKARGMGLGLSICRTIIEANGGSIWMETGPQTGTTFYFTLPRVDALEGGEGDGQ